MGATMTITLSARLEPLFRKAGWHEGRSVDISRTVEHLKSYGCPVGALVEEFLRKFMGLEIESLREGRLSVNVDDALFWFPDSDGGRCVASMTDERIPFGRDGFGGILVEYGTPIALSMGLGGGERRGGVQFRIWHPLGGRSVDGSRGERR
jgi:hypothetical protein